MNVYESKNIRDVVQGNPYVGRGIVAGLTEDGKKACAAYFIMGRSANSRNRIFTEKNGAVFTAPFDESKVEDPSLIIYAAIRPYGKKLYVSNGDQTDTIVAAAEKGVGFVDALKTRTFEPDKPHFTPRISAELDFANGFSYTMSILKSADENGTACDRYFYEYEGVKGRGHFIHTYVTDGNPLPTFTGEPHRVKIPSDIDAFSNELWSSLDENNKISLYVRYVDLATGETENRLFNKNK